MIVQITTVTPEEDWKIVSIDGVEYHAGHEIPDFVWMALLKKGGVTVVRRRKSAHSLGVCGIGCKQCHKGKP